MTSTVSAIPALSCYTTNLIAYLEPDLPDVRRRLADATRLAVRTDLPAGELAFSQHDRIDRSGRGWQLGYRGAASWPAARAALAAELAAHGRVLAVANTAYLPWSPAADAPQAPHWVLIEGGGPDRWLVTDHLTALVGGGEQLPFAGWLADSVVAHLLTAPLLPAVETIRRDAYALGSLVPLPQAAHYRWLAREPELPDRPEPGAWLREPVAVLRLLADRLSADPAMLTRHTDDLWAAGRHHQHRMHVRTGELPTDATALDAAWTGLPRALRFAADSAARNRPRPGLVVRAFDQLIDAVVAGPTAATAIPDED
ncbi:MAG TPA: hypothetical protein VGL06_03690 [Pseudonocardiaceae bacterium]